MAEIGATAKGRRPAPDADRGGQARPRPLPRRVRGRRADRPRRCDRQHVRPPPRPRSQPAAGAVRQPPRQPALAAANSTARWACWRGLEVMRSLNDLGIVTEAPVELVNWTDEEGSRFGHSLMGSGVWAGVYPLDKAYGLTDTEGVTRADRAGRHRLPRPRTGRRRSRPTPISSCTSSRARSWSARPSRSASSPAPRRRSGTTRSPPGRTATPAPRRRRRARMRWSAPRGSSTWWTA